MKKILINATQEEELRVAIVDGQKLIDLDIETSSAGRKKGNIYKGVITRIEPGLDAVFVDYGDPKHGFLPFREISQAYFKNKAAGGRNSSSAIAKSLQQGQALLVQVQREGHGGKGAALTTFISLAGRYLVLMPNSPRAGGVSRRMNEKERDTTRRTLSQLEVRDEEGVIIRTEGAGRDIKLLQHDLDYLRNLWNSIVAAAKSRPAPFLVYEESNLVICTLRDHFSDDTEEIVVDDEKIFADARDFIKLMMPQHLGKLKLYQEPVPLFNRYHIESQIETAFDREITLPSGGSVIFDRTEALLSIDINSGKATRSSNIEETALNTNLEAVEEIALQLRLRDLGGLIVIDFIDMLSVTNRKTVETRLHQAMCEDQARVQFERISRFGLLEMSRQRLRPSLGESSHTICLRCNGKGFIRTLESSALATLRMMEEEAIKGKSGRVVAQLPIKTASFLLNEKRDKINEIENHHGVELTIVPDSQMETPHFQIRRYRIDDRENRNKPSYEMATERKPALPDTHNRTGGTGEKPAVGPAVGFMDRKKAAGGRNSLLTWVASFLRKQPEEAESERDESGRHRRRRGGRRRGRSQDRHPQQSPPRESGRSQTPGRRHDQRTAGGEATTGKSQHREFRRTRKGQQPSSSRRRPPTSATASATNSARQTHGNRAMTPPAHITEQPPAHVADQPHAPNSPTGSTVFTPPMPTLPADTPSKTGDAGHGATIDKDTGGAASPAGNRPTAPATPSFTPSASKSTPDPGPKPGDEGKPPETAPGLTRPTPGSISKAASEAAPDNARQNKPSAYPSPRFSKPSHLTQVETKVTPTDRD